MANDLTNYIKFDKSDIETATGVGIISTLDRDMNIEVLPFTSNNEKAPSHQVFAKSPAGHNIPVGGIWKKQNSEGKDYFALSVKAIGFNANLGRYAGQDDDSLQAIIAWEPRAD